MHTKLHALDKSAYLMYMNFHANLKKPLKCMWKWVEPYLRLEKLETERSQKLTDFLIPIFLLY